MKRFKRLEYAKKKVELDKQYEVAAKRQQRKLMLEIRRELDVKGTLTKKMNSYIYSAAKILEKEHLEHQLKDLIKVCYEISPRIHTCPWQARPMHFFYFLRDQRFDEVDLAIRDGYMVLVNRYKPGVTLSTKPFLGLGKFLLKRLRDWVGEDAGNSDEDLIVDYLSLIMNQLGKTNSKWLLRPDQLLGDLGWTIFMEQVELKYGGLSGYKKPTRGQLKETDKMQEVIKQLAAFRTQCIEDGDLTRYNELEQKIGFETNPAKISKLLRQYV